jgi:hypothetical protein
MPLTSPSQKKYIKVTPLGNHPNSTSGLGNQTPASFFMKSVNFPTVFMNILHHISKDGLDLPDSGL